MEQQLLAILDKLVEIVSKASTEVWRIALRQVTGVAILDLVLGLVFLLFAVWAIRNIGKTFREKQVAWENWLKAPRDSREEKHWDIEDNMKIGKIIVCILGIIAGIPGFILLAEGFQRLWNPEYYTIMLILQMIPAK